jgi:hypothetical protein
VGVAHTSEKKEFEYKMTSKQLTDIFTLCHMAAGAAFAYFTRMPVWVATIAHLLFEIAESCHIGVVLLNEVNDLLPAPLKWPKYDGDSVANSNCDTLSFLLTFLIVRRQMSVAI